MSETLFGAFMRGVKRGLEKERSGVQAAPPVKRPVSTWDEDFTEPAEVRQEEEMVTIVSVKQPPCDPEPEKWYGQRLGIEFEGEWSEEWIAWKRRQEGMSLRIEGQSSEWHSKRARVRLIG